MKKIIFSDLDGTLINKQNEPLHEGNFEAIKKWREAGNLFVLCTGRNPIDILPTINIGNIEYDYLILCNGATIIDQSGNRIKEIEFPYDLGKKILLECAKNEEIITFYCDEKELVMQFEEDLVVIDHQGLVHKDIKGKTFREYVEKATCFKMLCLIQTNGENHLYHYEKELLEPNKNEISWFFNKNCIDMMGGDVSKGKGMMELADILGIKKENVYAIGDSFNDISMIKMAEHGCTFEDSPTELCDAANHIVVSVSEMIDMILSDKF